MLQAFCYELVISQIKQADVFITYNIWLKMCGLMSNPGIAKQPGI